MGTPWLTFIESPREALLLTRLSGTIHTALLNRYSFFHRKSSPIYRHPPAVQACFKDYSHCNVKPTFFLSMKVYLHCHEYWLKPGPVAQEMEALFPCPGLLTFKDYSHVYFDSRILFFIKRKHRLSHKSHPNRQKFWVGSNKYAPLFGSFS